jgi:hypothetical protein
MAEMNFNPNEVPEDDRGPMDPVPPGKYELQVVESAVVQTKTGNGVMLNLTHEIVSGPFANRKIWTRHNYQNANPDAQRIGQREIADLCMAVGHTSVLSDSAELHGIPYMATVGIEKDKTGQYADKNKISRFLPRDGAPTVNRPAAQTSRPAATSAPAQAAKPAGNRPAFLDRRTPGQTAYGR